MKRIMVLWESGPDRGFITEIDCLPWFAHPTWIAFLNTRCAGRVLYEVKP